MSPEAQRIAIAKACGWRKVREATDWHMKIQRFEGIEPGSKRSQIYRQPLPDYLNDLNAMHEAEKWLEDKRATVFRGIYTDYLCFGRIRNGDYDQSLHGAVWSAIHATAAERAEAFLRTLNLWDDTK